MYVGLTPKFFQEEAAGEGNEDESEQEEAKRKVSKFGAKQLRQGHVKVRQAIDKEVRHILDDPFYKSTLIETQ